MKTILSALAGVSLLAAALPNTAAAAPGGHGHGFSGGHSYSGGHGYYGGHGYGHGYYGGYPYFFGGLALGAALWDPWYYGYPYYYGSPAPYYYDGPPPPVAAPTQACGSWVWDAARAKYNWIGC